MGRKRLTPRPVTYLPPAAFGFKPGDRDEFGFVMHWSLLEGVEAKNEREAKVIATMQRLFEAAVRHLGEGTAVKAWAVAGRQKRGAKKGKARNPDRDADLLQLYDAELAKAVSPTEALPRLVAQTAEKNRGESVETTEKHLRRLLRKRDGSASYIGPPSLLGSAKGQE